MNNEGLQESSGQATTYQKQIQQSPHSKEETLGLIEQSTSTLEPESGPTEQNKETFS